MSEIKTSWAARAHLFLVAVSGPEATLPTNIMATSGNDVGYLDEDGFSLETEEGTELELRDINGKLLDSLIKEPTITVNFTLLKPNNDTKGKFWELGENGEVLSLVGTKYYALAFGNTGEDAVGTEAIFAPCSRIDANPAYSADKGWTLECTAKLLAGGAASETDRYPFLIKQLTASDLGITE